MKTTGIIMSGDHPQLVQDGTKTQTRRTRGLEEINQHPDDWLLSRHHIEKDWVFLLKSTGEPKWITCPYGQVGDRLWVRETHYRWGHWAKNGLSKTGKQKWTFKAESNEVYYLDNFPGAVQRNSFRGTAWYKRPSLFMPRSASRITRVITEVRAERVQEISIADCKAEGVSGYTFAKGCLSDNPPDPRWKFKELWDFLNAKRGYSWDANCWVWVIGW